MGFWLECGGPSFLGVAVQSEHLLDRCRYIEDDGRGEGNGEAMASHQGTFYSIPVRPTILVPPRYALRIDIISLTFSASFGFSQYLWTRPSSLEIVVPLMLLLHSKRRIPLFFILSFSSIPNTLFHIFNYTKSFEFLTFYYCC